MRSYILQFLLLICWLPLYAQVEITIKDKQTDGGLPYAHVQLFKNTTQHFIADNHGWLTINGVKQQDTIKLKISASGYQSIDTSIVFMNQKLSIFLEKVFTTLDTITVASKDISIQSDRVVIRFSKYVKKDTEMTGDVLGRLPGITKLSANEFKTVGNKTVVVYLDGRQLSPVEVAAVPAAIIAKAELVVLPSSDQAAENQAVLYLSSAMNIPQYSFTLLNGGYDLGGEQGPSFQINRATKSKNWNTNFLLNYYRRASKSKSTLTDEITGKLQLDTALNKTTALIYAYTATRVFSKDNLLTIGSIGNMSFANIKSASGIYNVTISELLHTKYNIQTLPFTFFSVWSKKMRKGKFSLSGMYDYNITNQKYIQQNDLSGEDDFSSINKSKANVASVKSSFTFNNKKIAGATFSNSVSSSVSLSNTAIDIIPKQGTNQHSVYADKRFYLGYNTGFSKKTWKYNLSFLYNYWIRDLNNLSYNQSYLYPKIVVSKKLNATNSIALSLTNQTYQPAPKMIVTDTFYTNNWLKKIGNENLKTEKMYKTELLHTYSGNKLFSQTILSYTFRKNAIVTGKIRTGIDSYLQNYFNKDYSVWLLSNSSQYTVSPKVSVSALFNLRNTRYSANVPKGFKNLYSVDGNLNANIEMFKGSLTGMFTFESVSLSYLRRTYQYPDMTFYYSKDIKPFLNLTITANNILNMAGKTKTEESMGILFENFSNQRSFGLSLTWTIGKRFPLLSAGDGSKIANDIKN